jgi:glucuronoarabinoxylan endo-1,4-beta-xylanase
VLKHLYFALALLTVTAATKIGYAQNCVVDWKNVHQRIDGFGASSAWRNSISTPQAGIFFSTSNAIVYTDNLSHTTTNNGIGLSLLRNHITYASTTSSNAVPGTSETSIMQQAQALGARVWSTPWTPAAGFKSLHDIYDTAVASTNSHGINGGSYLGSARNATNLAYASQLANYVRSMKTSYGINLYAISIQNEPDANVTNYEACQWSYVQIHDFTRILYDALSNAGVSSTKIMLPESQNWADYQNLAFDSLNDPTVRADVGIVADHNYDGLTGPGTLTKNSYGKPLWETEVSPGSTVPSDSSITNGVYYAQRIHLFMTQAQASAYHYWWLISGGTANAGLMDNNASITKRLFAFGQFSRFVRPGYYRIDAGSPGSTALISAYQNATNGSFAIVAINTDTTTAINQTFTLNNFSGVSMVTPWMTTSNLSLASQAPVAVVNSSFTYTLPPLSIVTFVGNVLTVALTSDANPSTYGNAATFTATVQTNGVPVGGISGETMTFYDGATMLGTGTLNSSSQATCVTTATQLPAGTNSITAVYAGDGTYSNATSAVFPQIVNPTNITVTAAANTKTYDGTTSAAAVPTVTAGNIQTGDSAPTWTETYDTPYVGIGNKTLTPSGVVNDNNGGKNYNYIFVPVSTGTISALALTVTNVLALDKVYDGTTNATLDATQAGLNGVLNSDNVTLDTSGESAYFADASVGTAKPVTVAGLALDGDAATNYMVLQPTDVTASILALVTPAFSSPAISGGAGGWQLNFSAQAGQSYRVLASDDLTLPLDQWTVLTNAMFDASGTATFTDIPATNLPQRFYQIGSP